MSHSQRWYVVLAMTGTPSSKTPHELESPTGFDWLQNWSLEGPLAAVVWLAALEEVYGLRLMPEIHWGLAGAVWWIYLMDRLIDAWRWPRSRVMTRRHFFCWRHRVWLGGVLLPTLAAVLVWLALFRIPRAFLLQAGTIGVLVLAYLVWQAVLSRCRNPLAGSPAKEVVGASLFSVGVFAGVLAEAALDGTPGTYVCQAMLTALFGANLLLLTVRESEEEGRGLQESRVWFVLLVVLGSGLCGSTILGWNWDSTAAPPGSQTQVAWACLAGLVVHTSLFRRRHGISPLQVRVLADAAVITPGAVLWLCG